MKFLRSWPVLAPLAVCGLLVGWIVLSVVNAQAVGFSIFIFAVANLIVYTDAIDFGLRLYMRRRHTAAAGGIVESGSEKGNLSINLAAILPPDTRHVVPASPFAIIASVYNLEDHLEEFTETFGPLSRAGLAHQRRLDRQYGAAADVKRDGAASTMASTGASPAPCAACSSACRRTSRPSW